jgi:RHS repeat-associated protein
VGPSPSRPAPRSLTVLPLSEVPLGPVVMAEDPCEAAFGCETPTGARKYYRARYMDPKMGRFISEDPIGIQGGPNFYSYVGNNPLSFRDPLGLLECVTRLMEVTAYCDKGPGADVHYWYHVKGTPKHPGSVGPGTCAAANSNGSGPDGPNEPPYPWGSLVFVLGEGNSGGVSYTGTIHDTGAGWNCNYHCTMPDQWIDIWLPCKEAKKWGVQFRWVLICWEEGKKGPSCPSSQCGPGPSGGD